MDNIVDERALVAAECERREAEMEMWPARLIVVKIIYGDGAIDRAFIEMLLTQTSPFRFRSVYHAPSLRAVFLVAKREDLSETSLANVAGLVTKLFTLHFCCGSPNPQEERAVEKANGKGDEGRAQRLMLRFAMFQTEKELFAYLAFWRQRNTRCVLESTFDLGPEHRDVPEIEVVAENPEKWEAVPRDVRFGEINTLARSASGDVSVDRVTSLMETSSSRAVMGVVLKG